MFQIGQFFHVIHMVSDLDRADDWYDEVFGVQRFYKGHLAVEKRDASLVVISDTVIEPMSPSAEAGAELTPVGRFHQRFGQHLHSLAWYVTDLRALAERMRAQGIRVTGPGGVDLEHGPFPGSIYTHPKDTHGLIEFVDQASSGAATGDPRRNPGFSPAYWRDEHPLGIEGVSHLAVVVQDLEPAVAFYTRTLGGTVVRRDPATPGGTESAFVAVGEDSVIELARPHSTDGLAGRDLATNGEIVHAVTFQVRDLTAAERHLADTGVRVVERQGDDLVLDPQDCFGAVIKLSPNSPTAR